MPESTASAVGHELSIATGRDAYGEYEVTDASALHLGSKSFSTGVTGPADASLITIELGSCRVEGSNPDPDAIKYRGVKVTAGVDTVFIPGRSLPMLQSGAVTRGNAQSGVTVNLLLDGLVGTITVEMVDASQNAALAVIRVRGTSPG